MAVPSAARARKPDGPRRDPAPRSVEGVVGPRLKNRDPDKHYVLCNPLDNDSGLSAYLENGYQIVPAGGDAILSNGKSVSKHAFGESVQTYKDQVLVAIPKAELAEMVEPERERAERLWRERLRKRRGTDDFSRERVRASSGEDAIYVEEGKES